MSFFVRHDEVADEDGDRCPDQHERGELEGGELFAEEQDREQELSGRRGELEQPDGAQREQAHSVSEADERDDGEDSTQQHEQGDGEGCGLCHEDSGVGLREVDHESDADWEEHGHFEGESDGAGDIDLFAEQAVDPEAGGEEERDPGESAPGVEFGDGHHDDGGGGDRDGEFLEAGKILA